MVDRGSVEAAARRIDGHVRRTPSVEVAPGLWFKLELLQHSGSFKARGAFNLMLAAQEEGRLPAAGVVVASGGNAGLAVAYAAKVLRVPAEVFVPVAAPEVKVRKLRELGAVVHRHGSEYAEAFEAAVGGAERTGQLLVHAYDQPEIVAGQGTLGLELPDADTVLVATGGGGLVAGIAAAVGDRMRVVAVEPEGAPTLHEALRRNTPVDVKVDSVAGDSLGARRIGEIAFEVAVHHGIRSVLVSDEAIVRARTALWQEHRIVVEHGAAAAWAALDQAYGRTIVVLCGANTDLETLQDLSQAV